MPRFRSWSDIAHTGGALFSAARIESGFTPARLARSPGQQVQTGRAICVPTGSDATNSRRPRRLQAVRLTELRRAAAQIAVIGECYKIRGRSTRATYGGILCTLGRSRDGRALFDLAATQSLP